MARRFALVLSVAVLALASCADPDPDTDPDLDTDAASQPAAGAATSAAPPPAPPKGTRWVGVGQAVVAVPTSWSTQETHCGQPTAATVYFVWPQARSCQVGRPGVPSLALTGTDSPSGRSVVEGSQPGQPVAGREVLERDLGCQDKRPPVCSSALAIPSEDAVFLMTGAHRGRAGTMVQQIAGSLTFLPDGYTTVPFIGFGESVGDAKRELERAGLVGTSPDVDWPHYATETVPAAGTVVPVGAVVELRIGDG